MGRQRPTSSEAPKRLHDRVSLIKLAGEQRYLAKSRSMEPGAYFELSVSPWGQIRCTCPGFQFRHECRHAKGLARRLEREKARARAVQAPPEASRQ